MCIFEVGNLNLVRFFKALPPQCNKKKSQMSAVLRFKRKACDEPVEGLVVVSKKSKCDEISNTNEVYFKFAATLKNEVSFCCLVLFTVFFVRHFPFVFWFISDLRC